MPCPPGFAWFYRYVCTSGLSLSDASSSGYGVTATYPLEAAIDKNSVSQRRSRYVVPVWAQERVHSVGTFCSGVSFVK